jgi:hypothetical protein
MNRGDTLLVGLFLSIVYGAIYLLIVCADGFEALLAYWGRMDVEVADE